MRYQPKQSINIISYTYINQCISFYGRAAKTKKIVAGVVVGLLVAGLIAAGIVLAVLFTRSSSKHFQIDLSI